MAAVAVLDQGLAAVLEDQAVRALTVEGAREQAGLEVAALAQATPTALDFPVASQAGIKTVFGAGNATRRESVRDLETLNNPESRTGPWIGCRPGTD